MSNAAADLIGVRHLRGMGHLLAWRPRAVRQADERDPQGRVLGLACVRRLVILGAGERIFLEPLTIERMSTTVFGGGSVAHVCVARP